MILSPEAPERGIAATTRRNSQDILPPDRSVASVARLDYECDHSVSAGQIMAGHAFTDRLVGDVRRETLTINFVRGDRGRGGRPLSRGTADQWGRSVDLPELLQCCRGRSYQDWPVNLLTGQDT
jgi:hypothetical protein